MILEPEAGRAYPMGRIWERWIDAKKGAFILVPGGVVHDFENRTGERAGVLSVSVPGDFEEEMPGIAAWFAENPPKDAGT